MPDNEEMLAWCAIEDDHITRAYYERYQCAIFDGWVAHFIGPRYHWTGYKGVTCKTEQEAARTVAGFYKSFVEARQKMTVKA